MRGIFYRSDTRHPFDPPGALFTNGFDKRDASYFDPVVRFPMTTSKTPDIEPWSAVCFTRDFLAAPLFPVSDLTCNSWVYVLNLESKNIYNTQSVQYEYATSNNLLAGKATGPATDVLWPMFGQERAVNSIAAGDIVGAVEVSRNFYGKDVFGGGTFRCLMYLPNPGFTGDDAIIESVQRTMNTFVKGGTSNMPTKAMGVVKSTRR